MFDTCEGHVRLDVRSVVHEISVLEDQDNGSDGSELQLVSGTWEL